MKFCEGENGEGDAVFVNAIDGTTDCWGKSRWYGLRRMLEGSNASLQGDG